MMAEMTTDLTFQPSCPLPDPEHTPASEDSSPRILGNILRSGERGGETFITYINIGTQMWDLGCLLFLLLVFLLVSY